MKKIFTFCPSCSSQNFTFENNVRFHCNDCDFVYFHNIAGAVATILTYKDEVLFTVRNENPDKGKWDLPGGFIDPNETAEQAVCREIKEELGLDFQPSQLQYITTSPNNYLYRNVPYRTIDIFYEIPVQEKNNVITAKEEIQDLIWVKRCEINLNKIGFVSIRKVIEEYYFEKAK